MCRRSYIVLVLLLVGTQFGFAQWSERDSLNLQQMLSGGKEIRLNPDAVKSIRLESPVDEMPDLFAPLMDTTNPIVDFSEDLPTFFIRKEPQPSKKIFLSLKPFSVFAKYSDVYGIDENNVAPMAVKCYMRPYLANEMKIGAPLPKAGGHSGQLMGGASISFSMEDILQTLFSKKGRARLHNAKHANAWKTY